MPELPEVETMARDMRPHLAGATIVAARLYKSDVLRGIRKPAFERGLTGRTVLKVRRRAKHVVVELDNDYRVVVQPRMTGSFGVRPRTENREPRTDYVVLDLDLSTGKIVFYRDVRRLGAIFLLSPTQWAKYDAAIGPEPLEKAFTAAKLVEILSGSRAAVKKTIMDQKKLAGVGNIYANEALWASGIDPSREARKIKPKDVASLRDEIVDVLARSVKGRGTTVRDYRTGTGEPGTFQGRLAVYGRAGEPCVRCGRRIVFTHAIDARATYFCPGCQR